MMISQSVLCERHLALLWSFFSMRSSYFSQNRQKTRKTRHRQGADENSVKRATGMLGRRPSCVPWSSNRETSWIESSNGTWNQVWSVMNLDHMPFYVFKISHFWSTALYIHDKRSRQNFKKRIIKQILKRSIRCSRSFHCNLFLLKQYRHET